MQSNDEKIKASWSEVTNQYQRRADLIPNLVNTVKGFAAHEKEVFTKVTEARARVLATRLSHDNDSNSMAQFQEAQKELSGALTRLLAISENYPSLKSDATFRDLQAQLEGTENRITVARNRYIQSMKEYNVLIRSFPSNILARAFGFKVKDNFRVENEAQISKPTLVDFSSK
ncbi:MAG TPA: LemA family protein [Gammaproteobacteria bacterium]|nr:LemA family protein [Gammaproteobacteria bacterium]